jgi:cation diffusion facilitator CzcD-associated flavoprotein CzcO
MPEDFPDYPDHFQIASYFEDFVDHFGLRSSIRFQTEVESVVPADGGGWEVTWQNREGESGTDHFSDVMVCNGHHWDKRWPEPAFPGSDTFEGEQMHAHDYRTPEIFEGKRVLVLGIGNSATDIAVEASRHADATFLSMRRGAWIVPKYFGSKPTDRATTGLMSRLPLKVHPPPCGRGPDRLRVAQTRPHAPPRSPDRLAGPARPARTRGHQGQEEHPAPRRRLGRLRGWQPGAG